MRALSLNAGCDAGHHAVWRAGDDHEDRGAFATGIPGLSSAGPRDDLDRTTVRQRPVLGLVGAVTSTQFVACIDRPVRQPFGSADQRHRRRTDERAVHQFATLGLDPDPFTLSTNVIAGMASAAIDQMAL